MEIFLKIHELSTIGVAGLLCSLGTSLILEIAREGHVGIRLTLGLSGNSLPLLLLVVQSAMKTFDRQSYFDLRSLRSRRRLHLLLEDEALLTTVP